MTDYDKHVAEKQAWLDEKKQIVKLANNAICALQKQLGMTSTERRYDIVGQSEIKKWRHYVNK